MNKCRSWPASMAVVVATAILPAANLEAGVPDLLPTTRKSDQKPAWVSESAAADGATIHWQHFTPVAKTQIQELLVSFEAAKRRSDGLETPEAPCAWEGPFTGGAFGGLSFDEAVATAKSVYSGTVLSSAQGFLLGHPGTLFEVVIDHHLKTPKLVSQPATLYFYFPDARIRLGDALICKAGDRASRPAIGSRVLLLARHDAASQENPILHPADDGLYFEDAEGQLSVPPALQELVQVRQLDFDHFVNRARQTLLDGGDLSKTGGGR